MDRSFESPHYGFYAKDLVNPVPLRQFTDQLAWQINESFGHELDVEVHIEPEAKEKSLYCVTLIVNGFSRPVVIQKSGRNILGLLKKVKRIALRKLHRLNSRREDLRIKRRLIRSA